MRKNLLTIVFLALLAGSWPVFAQESGAKINVVPGAEMNVKGVIVERSGDSLMVRDFSGSEVIVTLTPATEVKERKSNPFRGAARYSESDLVLGLNIEVEGRGNDAGRLEAEKIRFTKGDLKVAKTVSSRVTPVEHRLGETEARLKEEEQRSKRLSGQVEELGDAYKTTQESAERAQMSADEAASGVRTTNERISALDDYEVKQAHTVNFGFNSWQLTPEAKASLDEAAEQIKMDKGILLEVAGFASSEGNDSYNRQLSERRADAVIRYLVEQHNIPLRRIITPYGYGENVPVANNRTREGRRQNRRVEVRVLVNRGLTESANGGPTTPDATPQN